MRRMAPIAAIAGLLGAAAAQAATDLSGMWWIRDRSGTAAIDPAAIPFLPDALAQYRRNRAARALPAGQRDCLPDGTPRLMLSRYPFQILQRPEQITMVFERQHMVRMVYMDRPVPDDVDLSYMGYSTGHWQAGTLVVDTGAFNDLTRIDGSGIPHSDALHVVEELTLADKGATLRDRVTVTDPKTFSAPWSFTIDFARQHGLRLMEDVCVGGPPQRDAPAPPATR